MTTSGESLADSAVGKSLVECALLSARHLRLLDEELGQPDADLGRRRPLDAQRLRSWEAVQAYGVWLYVLARAMRPETVVETGVQNGCSTELILWALHRNRCGRLYSIDSGPTSSDGSHRSPWHATRDGNPGRDILDGLKQYWELTIGFSADCLPGLCSRLGTIDLFWHDSDHSVENVRFEFGTVKPFIPPGGILCLHDYSGQEIPLEPRDFSLVVPHEAPHLRAWRRTGGPASLWAESAAEKPEPEKAW